MKIVIINNLYPPYNKGGAETIIVNMVKKLENSGHEVFVISSSPKESYQGNNVYYIKSPYQKLKDKSTTEKLFLYLQNKQSKEIKEILIKEKPALVVTHNLLGLGFKTAKIISDLKIVHKHYLHDIQLLHPSGLMYYKKENIINSPQAKIYQYLNKQYFKNTIEVISPSKWLIELHQAKGFFKDAKTIIRKPEIRIEKINIAKDENLCLFVGQIEPHKGIKELLSAFEDIKDKRLELVGDGSLKGQNKDNIKFLGRLNRGETLNKIAEANLLIVPSICYENYPTVILEAQALGTKVIGSKLGGISELLQEDEMFEPMNINSLKDKIKELV